LTLPRKVDTQPEAEPDRPELISLECGREPAVLIGSLIPASLIPSGRSMGPVSYRVLLVEGGDWWCRSSDSQPGA
jgi:hypothetical protein